MPKTKKVIKKTVKTEVQPVDLRPYELVVVVSSKVKAEKRPEVISAVQRTIEKLEGKIETTQELGLRDLAYPIAHEQSGWYAKLTISLPPGNVAKFNQAVHIEKRILRHLLVNPS